tara:strand:+ start:213 stop:467 length:255 start_codon:yes stop_codon:yes gene_type:complete
MLIDSLVFIIFIFCFTCIAETVFWSCKNEFLKAKAKYLRNIIDQKNDLSSYSNSYFDCIYRNWDEQGMELSEATTNCRIKLGIN